MSLFKRVTATDMEDIKHAIDVLNNKLEKNTRSIKAAGGVQAGLSRRIKILETALAEFPDEDPDLDEDLEEEDQEEPLESSGNYDRETERLRIGRGQ